MGAAAFILPGQWTRLWKHTWVLAGKKRNCSCLLYTSFVTVGVAAVPLTVKDPVTNVAPVGMVSVNGKFVKAFKLTLVTVMV